MSTTNRPRLLDLCGGVGGAGEGYYQAGFDVVGVDLKPQPNYPFEFHQADAIQYLIDHGPEFDVIHASWPCQGYSIATPTSEKMAKAADWYSTELIPLCREICDEYALPLVMENVARAERDYRHPLLVVDGEDLGPLFDGLQWVVPVQRPIVLCGEMFGLQVIRHRVFEVGEMCSPLAHQPHRGSVADGTYITVAGHGADNPKGHSSVSAWKFAMGMPWAKTRHELAEAIPPAYTRYIGTEVLKWL